MVNHRGMTRTRRLPISLSHRDVTLATLLTDLEPVAPVELALAQALGCVAAETQLPQAFPPYDIATADGWALRSHELVGASSYSPLALPASPVWVEAGDRMPEGCDCVVDADLVDATAPLVQVMAEAIPGQGVRRAGDDLGKDSSPVAAGLPVRPLDLLVARAAGLGTLKVRRPRLRVINVPGGSITMALIAESARRLGAGVSCAQATSRDAGSVAAMLRAEGFDLLVTVGGSGLGRSDATIAALAACGEVVAHGIALQPGRTAAVGRVADVPLVALPGAPDQGLAAWWALALPLLDRLSGRKPRQEISLPLARKIASPAGIAEIVLVERVEGAWMPLAAGELPLAALARADAWLLVPAGSEGFAAGAPVGAYMIRE